MRRRSPFLRPSPLPSTPSAAAPHGLVRALHRYYEARPTPRLFRGSFGSSPSCRGPGSPQRLRAKRGLPGSDAILSCVIWSMTTAERQPLAEAGPHMLPSTFPTVSASASFWLSRLNTYPTRSLCTLRDSRRRRPRNTRYRAPATAYPDRSSTGRIAPAYLAHRESRENKTFHNCKFRSRWTRRPALKLL